MVRIWLLFLLLRLPAVLRLGYDPGWNSDRSVKSAEFLFQPLGICEISLLISDRKLEGFDIAVASPINSAVCLPKRLSKIPEHT